MAGLVQRTIVRTYDQPDQPKIVVVGQAEFAALERRTGKTVGEILNGIDADAWGYLAFRATHRGQQVNDADYDTWLAGIASVLPEEQDDDIATQDQRRAAADAWWAGLSKQRRAELIAASPDASVVDRWEASGEVLPPQAGAPAASQSPSSSDGSHTAPA